MSEHLRFRTPRYAVRASRSDGLGVAHENQSATRWEPRYRLAIVLCDLLTTLLVVLVAGMVLPIEYSSRGMILALEAATVAALIGSFLLIHVWHPKFLGQGTEEFTKLGHGLFGAVVALGLAEVVIDFPGARLWILTTIPAIAMLVFPQRYVLRKLLHRKRAQGRCLLPVLAAGDVDSVRDLISRTRAAPHLGWRVAAVCTTRDGSRQMPEVDEVPVIGNLTELADQVRRGGYRIVAVTPDRYWTPSRLQQLAWNLEGTGAELIVASGLMEIAGPRLHVSGVLGMPMLWVSEPVFTGFPRIIKELFDRAAATVLLILLAPVLLTTAVLVAGGSRGPVFYRQRRVGKGESEFMMIKFRTMVAGADRMRDKLGDHDDGAGPLFKVRRDPRITRVGAVLRRYSIDELPQLFNVVRGQMSLVGPRPPLPDETACYEPHVRRRLLVKPGVTGLWQVSGRSDLPWEEAVRLDLRYVEDWSLALDFMILWKTVRAVFGGRGAY